MSVPVNLFSTCIFQDRFPVPFHKCPVLQSFLNETLRSCFKWPEALGNFLGRTCVCSFSRESGKKSCYCQMFGLFNEVVICLHGAAVRVPQPATRGILLSGAHATWREPQLCSRASLPSYGLRVVCFFLKEKLHITDPPPHTHTHAPPTHLKGWVLFSLFLIAVWIFPPSSLFPVSCNTLAKKHMWTASSQAAMME